MPANTGTTELLGRVIEPLSRCLTPAAAKEIVSLRPDKRAVLRIQKLAAKCDAGTLTPEEKAQYQTFVEVGDVVAVLQVKVRRYLAKQHA